MAHNFFTYVNLLMWKNFKIKLRHKKELIVEILVPVLFCSILYLVRSVSRIDRFDSYTNFAPVTLSTTNLDDLFSIHFKFNAGIIAYAPLNPFNDQILANVAKKLSKEPKGFKNEDELQYYMDENNIFYGVVFNTNPSANTSTVLNRPNQLSPEYKYDTRGLKNDNNLYYNPKTNTRLDAESIQLVKSLIPEKFDFTIRVPPKIPNTDDLQLGWDTSLFFRKKLGPGPIDMGSSEDGSRGYITSELAALQYFISNAYIEEAGKLLSKFDGVRLPKISMQRFPYPPFVIDPVVTVLQIILPLIIILSFAYPVSQTVKHVTYEKEKLLTETMKIMGLKTSHHWTSWYLTSFILIAIIVALIVIIFKIPVTRDEVGIIPSISWLVFLLFMLCYGASLVAFAFMISSFFTKSIYAGSWASVAWVLTFIPAKAASVGFIASKKSLLTILCLFSNTAMAMGVDTIVQWENIGQGAHFANMWQNPGGSGTLSVGSIILMLLLDSVIYMLIALYVEKVLPGEIGVKYPWNFCFLWDFWWPSKSSKTGPYKSLSTEDLTQAERFEHDPTTVGKTVGIRVQNLRKNFGEKVAVDNLSLEMYENEITVLLGHNGAGKTTTISMITGFMMPTSGTILVNGMDTSRNMTQIRSSLGICPQHNVLFDHLTVGEHISFYCKLKGFPQDQIEGEIDRYLRILQLSDKRDALSHTLSGGMKRKLSLVAALCGGSKVVLCDEPSSGMDPEARRALWSLLEMEKKNRTILLTTHFMDEADVLGDRIAIMSGGKLACSGTPFFLKKQFGSGYQLICNKTTDCHPDTVTRLIRQYIPDAIVKSNVGSELSYTLQESYVSQFEPLLFNLENSQNQLGIDGYGISMATLEDVFMRTGSEIHSTPTNETLLVESLVAIDEESELVPPRKRQWYQWHAMFFKKWICMQRNYVTHVLQILFPLVFFILMIKNELFGIKVDLPNLKLSLEEFGQTHTVLSSNDSAIGQAYENMFKSSPSTNKLIVTNQGISDVLSQLGTGLTNFDKTANYLVAASIADDQITAWFNHEAMHTVPLALNLVQRAIAKRFLGNNHDIQVSVHPLPFSPKYSMSSTGNEIPIGLQLASCFAFTIPLVSALFVLFVTKERVSKAKHLQTIGGVPAYTYWLSHLILDMLIYVIIGFCVVVLGVICKLENFTSAQAQATFFLIWILYGFASLPFTYLLSFAFENPPTGLSRCYLLNLLTGFGFSITSFVLRNLYMGSKTERILRYVFLLFPSFGLCEAIEYLFTYSENLRRCSQQEMNSSDNTFFGLKCDNNSGMYDWNYPGIGANIIFFIGTGFLYLMLIILIDTYMRYLHNIKNILRPKFPTPSAEVDDDVQGEKDRVENMSMEGIKQNTMVIRKLTKFYGRFLAVKNLSVSVKHGDCFGLLGVNGAGKTSAFKMLTGDENISYGNVWIEGHDMQEDMNQIRDMIGYCPQFDALLTEMTGYELLKMFCLIHGIPRGSIRGLVGQLARDLAFEDHLYRQCGNYSGGNKRKLSTAIALLGAPHIVYLDEPTSGIDPASRRKLWDMVCLLRNAGKGIILTSHSMEECEALCTRIAIMVNGEFKCLGSTQHLKNKFSKGISLSIKLKKIESTVESDIQVISDEIDRIEGQVIEFITKSFPGASLKDRRLRLLTFDIPLNVMPYSRIFGLMEKNRENLNIEDYSLTQATLEQIFIQFAQQQYTLDSDKKKK